MKETIMNKIKLVGLLGAALIILPTQESLSSAPPAKAATVHAAPTPNPTAHSGVANMLAQMQQNIANASHQKKEGADIKIAEEERLAFQKIIENQQRDMLRTLGKIQHRMMVKSDFDMQRVVFISDDLVLKDEVSKDLSLLYSDNDYAFLPRGAPPLFCFLTRSSTIAGLPDSSLYVLTRSSGATSLAEISDHTPFTHAIQNKPTTMPHISENNGRKKYDVENTGNVIFLPGVDDNGVDHRQPIMVFRISLKQAPAK